MSQWTKLTELCCKNISIQERINELYQRIHFPYKFRSLYSDWIESKHWSAIDTTNDAGRQEAKDLFMQLMERIDATEEEIKEAKDFDLTKSLDFRAAKDLFQKSFGGNFPTFVNILNSCMKEERSLIESMEIDNCDMKRKVRSPPIAQEGAQIKSLLEILSQQIGIAENMVQDMSLKQDAFHIQFNTVNERISCLESQLTQQPPDQTRRELTALKSTLERDRNKRISENFERRTAVADDLVRLAKILEELLAAIWKEIEKWQDVEKRAITALVTPVDGTIESLEKMCREGGGLLKQLVDHIEETLTVFNKLPYNDDKKLAELNVVLNDLRHRCLDIHLAHVFVIDRNVPDRILKISSGKSTSFNVSVRILGGKSLGVHCSPPSVKLSVFQEKCIPDSCEPMNGFCEIINGNDRPLTVNRGTDAVAAEFGSIVLSKVKRPEHHGRNEELVTEMKYAFVFYTTVKILGREIKLRTISLPVILTSQTSQEIMAKGTLIWDAAFSEQDRKPFVYRDKVKWAELAAILSALFVQNTGRGLTKEHLHYLARLAFRQKKDISDDKEITEKLVIRDRMTSSRDFSFWKWFYANMNLVREHVKNEWQDELIYGFISKDDARRLMIDFPIGTFLLRFSETNIEASQKTKVSGCLTLAFVEMDPETGQKKLFHVREYLSPKELAEKGLAPVLDAMEVADSTRPGQKKKLLRFLFPDQCTSFGQRFGKYITEKERKDSDYRRGKFNIEIYLTNEQPGSVAASDTSSCPPTPCPSTPQSSAMMSPQYEGSVDNQAYSSSSYSPAFVVYNGATMLQQQQVPTPLRQMAAVRPQTACGIVHTLADLPLDAIQQLLQQQQPDQDDQLVDQQWLNITLGEQIYTLQDPSSVIDPSSYLLSSADLALTADDQSFVGLDEDGDMMVMTNSLIDASDRLFIPTSSI